MKRRRRKYVKRHSGINLSRSKKSKNGTNKILKRLVVVSAIFLVGIIGISTLRAILFGASVLIAGGGDSSINQGRTTLVFDTGKIWVVSVDRVNNTADIVSLPANVYAQLPSEIGRYRLGAIYDIAELRKQGSGGEDLRHATEKLLGIPVDGYVKSKTELSLSDDVEALRHDITSINFLVDMVKTNGYSDAIATDISSLDMVKLWLISRQVRFDKVVAHVYRPGLELEQQILADGSQVLGVNTTVSDRTISDTFNDPILVRESLKVEIINASGINGLGYHWGRLLTTMGAQVVRIDTAELPVESSQIILMADAKESHLVKRLLKMGTFSIIEAQNEQTKLGDITIILGKL